MSGIMIATPIALIVYKFVFKNVRSVDTEGIDIYTDVKILVHEIEAALRDFRSGEVAVTNQVEDGAPVLVADCLQMSYRIELLVVLVQ